MRAGCPSGAQASCAPPRWFEVRQLAAQSLNAPARLALQQCAQAHLDDLRLGSLRARLFQCALEQGPSRSSVVFACIQVCMWRLQVHLTAARSWTIGGSASATPSTSRSPTCLRPCRQGLALRSNESHSCSVRRPSTLALIPRENPAHSSTLGQRRPRSTSNEVGSLVRMKPSPVPTAHTTPSPVRLSAASARRARQRTRTCPRRNHHKGCRTRRRRSRSVGGTNRTRPWLRRRWQCAPAESGNERGDRATDARVAQLGIQGCRFPPTTVSSGLGWLGGERDSDPTRARAALRRATR